MKLKHSPHLKILKGKAPWPHFVIDGLLPEPSFKAIQSRLLQNKTEFQRQPNDPEEIDFAVLPDMDLNRFFFSAPFKNFLEGLSQSRLKIHEKSAIQLRRMTPDSPAFPPHFDFIDQKSLIMLYYISPGWTPEKGAELLLHQNENSCEVGPETQWISPIDNRMVLFFSDKTNWHSVRRVNHWTRFLIMAEWIVTTTIQKETYV